MMKTIMPLCKKSEWHYGNKLSESDDYCALADNSLGWSVDGQSSCIRRRCYIRVTSRLPDERYPAG